MPNEKIPLLQFGFLQLKKKKLHNHLDIHKLPYFPAFPENAVDNEFPLPCPDNEVRPSKPVLRSVKTQVLLQEKKHFRSFAVQCAPKMVSRATQTDFTPTPIHSKTTQENFKGEDDENLEVEEEENPEVVKRLKVDIDNLLSSPSPESESDDDSDYEPEENEFEENEEWSCLFISQLIEKYPKMYIGIPEEWMFMIDELILCSGLSKNEIYVTLMKIRLNDTFERLGHQFGLSKAQVSRIFNKTVPVLAFHFKTMIFWPEKKSILLNLPIAFRYRYKNVQSIIDCFEIEIQKPSRPINQALTWSEYKKANTLKYLISSTPDGFINYISKGYGGRITDALIVEECGYLDVLPVSTDVMADRGFKQIDNLLQKKKCKLIRPPSVSETVKPSKAEVIEAKRIAAVRIHIERAIRRLREFNLLLPHSVVHHRVISIMDDVVTIASALSNLQSLLIAT